MQLPEFLTLDEHGTIHITDHRIGLDDVIFFYRRGESAEMLQLRFPTISLACIHRLIAFYLDNEQEVDHYVDESLAESALQRSNATPIGPGIEELRRRRNSVRLARGA